MSAESSTAPIASFDSPASMECWDGLIDFIQLQADVQLEEGSANYRLRLACEELISNSIRHAQWPEEDSSQPQPHIWLRVFKLDKEVPELLVEIDDNGSHFDPDINEPRNIEAHLPINERSIGGLGLFLVQQTVDKVEYLRSGDRNRYRLFVKFPSSSS